MAKLCLGPTASAKRAIYRQEPWAKCQRCPESKHTLVMKKFQGKFPMLTAVGQFLSENQCPRLVVGTVAELP